MALLARAARATKASSPSAGAAARATRRADARGRSHPEADRGRRGDRVAAAARRESSGGASISPRTSACSTSCSTCCCSCSLALRQEWLWSAALAACAAWSALWVAPVPAVRRRAQRPRRALRWPAPRSSCCPRTCSFATIRPRGCSRSFGTSRRTSCCSSSTRPSGRAMSDELRADVSVPPRRARHRRVRHRAVLALRRSTPSTVRARHDDRDRGARAHAGRSVHAVRRASALADDAAARADRNRAARLAGGAPRRRKGPVAVMGDFNVTPYSPFYADLLDEDGPHRHAPRPHAEPELACVLASSSASPSIIAS